MIKLKNLLNEDKTVFKDDWFSVKTTTVKGSDEEFTYMHEQGTKGKSIAVLLYRRKGKDAWEYGIRKEIIPAWGDKPTYCSLTGTVEAGDVLEERAIKEIEEESGYKVKEKDLESLGTCYGAKSIDTVFHLFAVDVGDLEPEEPEGDGSDLEDKSKFEWTYFNKNDYEKFQCSILSTMILRLGFN